MNIGVRVTGAGSLHNAFALMQSRLADLHPAFALAAVEMLDAAKEQINEEGNPPWAPKKRPNGQPLLVRTGALKASLSATEAVADIPGGVRVGTDIRYAKYQQGGTRRIPARPFLFAQSDRPSLTSHIRAIFARRIAGEI